MTVITRMQHKEARCVEVKKKQLQCWEDFDAYEGAKDEGQKTLGLVWVLVEKLIEGRPGVKARLVVRGK